MKKEKQPKVRKPDYIGARKFWAWQSREVSDAGFMFLMGYVVFYCTDVLKLNPLLVGTLFAASKVIDGITDIIAGYIVDRTNTRWGRGRPYDICLVGAWSSIILLFLCPVSWNPNAKLAWVVFWYIIGNAVFYTLLNAGEGVFSLRAFTKPQIVKQSSQGAIATSLLGFSAGVFIPQMIAAAGTDQSAWLKAVIIFAIPLTLIGLCRMIFVKEENPDVQTTEEKVKTDLKGIFTMFGKNKYLMIWCCVELIANIISNMGVGVFFFGKILGDIGLQSLFAVFAPLCIVSLLILPKLIKKFHISKIIRYGSMISIVCGIISFMNYRNIPVLMICAFFSTVATLPATYAAGIFMYEMADYNEFLGLNRMEGSMSSLRGFMRRAGSALGTFLLGVGLTLIQYDAAAETLAPVTYYGILFMQFGLPVIGALLQVILWFFYDIEKKQPAIKEKLEANRAAYTE